MKSVVEFWAFYMIQCNTVWIKRLQMQMKIGTSLKQKRNYISTKHMIWVQYDMYARIDWELLIWIHLENTPTFKMSVPDGYRRISMFSHYSLNWNVRVYKPMLLHLRQEFEIDTNIYGSVMSDDKAVVIIHTNWL